MVEKKLDKKNCKVTFILDKGDFSEFDDIRVLGDFNGWHYEKGLIMELKKNQFKATSILKAGTSYEFRYILNGRHWFNDPQADGLVDSPFYGINNTLLVIEESAKPATKEVKTASTAKAVKTATPKKTIPTLTEMVTAESKPNKKATVKASEAKVVAPKKVTAKPTSVGGDDLKLIEGIGPKIAELLQNEGITSFAILAKTKVEKIEAILKAAGSRYALANPGTWPQQAKLAAAGKIEDLKKLQDELKGGVK